MKTLIKINHVSLNNAGEVYQIIKHWNAEKLSQHLFECVVDGHNGIYSGQVFAERFPCGNCTQEDWEILEAGPSSTNEDYFEVWDEVGTNWKLNSLRIYSGESGDTFVYDNNVLELWEAITGKDFWRELEQ